MKPTHHAHQRGAATLVVVMVLFFIVSLVAAYTSRNLLFEQRTANNQLRSTQALETAEAGVEWALSMLNGGRIDASCAPSSSTTDSSFRERYLQVDGAGNMWPDPNPTGGDLTPLCVYNGSGWTCNCPSSGTAAVVAPNSTQSWPAFRVRFQRILESNPANAALPYQPGVIRIQVVGCTRLDPAGAAEPCLAFNGQGAFNEGRVLISSNLAISGGPSSPPVVALMARQTITITGTGISAYNSVAGGSGFTLQAGGAINAGSSPTLVSLAGSPGGASSTLQNDIALSGIVDAAAPSVYTAGDRMFSAVFNTRPDAFRTQQAAIELACAGAPAACTTEQVRAVTRLNPGRPVWVAGDLTMDSGNDIGSAADPAVLVVNGNVQWAGVNTTIFGLVYARTANWATGGAGRIVGAAVAEAAVSGNGTTSFIHDPDVLRIVRWNTGSFVRVPGSWKDYQQ